MNSDIKNSVIVIGGEHYNALGVIRSLGEANIKPYFILIAKDKICPTSYSKYIKKTFKIKSEKDEDIIDFLVNNFNDEEEKPIIIPTGDPIEKLLDTNYNKLSKKYIMPNINETQGMIVKHMDKDVQHKLCEKYNIKTAQSFLIDLKNIDEKLNILPEKIIIKPDVSADGKKSDILIVEGKEEIKNGLLEFKEKGYKNVMVQEFINYETEYAMMGMACKDKVIIPGINDNIFIYPSNRGNTSYSEMFPLADFPIDVSPIINMIKDMNYTGLFEVEMFKVGNEIYFNEINLRNSANLYSYMGNNVNYINVYLNLILGKDISKLKTQVDKHYYFCIEPLHLKNVKEKVVTFKEWKKHVKNSTTLIYNKKDKKPFFMRLVNSIYLRITHQL